jgi:hypothetical protein
MILQQPAIWCGAKSSTLVKDERRVLNEFKAFSQYREKAFFLYLSEFINFYEISID